MRRCIIWLVIGAPLALLGVAGATTSAVPTLRHLASGLRNVPDRLPALPDNSQVHYQQGAEDYARVVSAMLPAVSGIALLLTVLSGITDNPRNEHKRTWAYQSNFATGRYSLPVCTGMDVFQKTNAMLDGICWDR